MQGFILTDFDFQQLKTEISESVVSELAKKLPSLLPPQKQDQILSRREAAKFLGLSLPTLHGYTITGIIQGYRIGNNIRYKKLELEKALINIKTSKNR